MKKFTHRFTVNAPLAVVAAFHRDSRALRQLTPPPILTQFHQVEPMADGSVADFTMWVGPLPIRWTAVHSQVTPQGFIDTQTRGPFRSWRHQHRFQELEANQTEVVDDIEAEPGSWLSWLMWFNLPLLFAYRGWQTRRLCHQSRRPPNSPKGEGSG